MGIGVVQEDSCLSTPVCFYVSLFLSGPQRRAHDLLQWGYVTYYSWLMTSGEAGPNFLKSIKPLLGSGMDLQDSLSFYIVKFALYKMTKTFYDLTSFFSLSLYLTQNTIRVSVGVFIDF